MVGNTGFAILSRVVPEYIVFEQDLKIVRECSHAENVNEKAKEGYFSCSRNS